MSIITSLFSGGVSELLKGAGSLAKDIRTAITGEVSIPPELKTQIDSKLIELEGKLSEADTKLAEYQSNIIVAEAQSQSWLARNWRPILMLTIVAIVANNYIIYPYLSMFTSKAVILSLPDHLYSLMKIGVGGYIVGRSAEQIAKNVRRM